MSIATAITNLQGKIANAYTAIQEKGGTLPATQNAENLSATIVDLPAGSSSKWGMTLDEVCTVDNQGTLKMFGEVSGNVNFTGITSLRPISIIGFAGSPVKSVSFPDLTEGDFTESFLGCSCLTATSFPSLLSGNFSSAFVSCTSLTGISFPNLLSGEFSLTFNSCTNLSSVSFPSLLSASITGPFKGCTNLTSVSFPALTAVWMKGGFAGCSDLVSISFPNLGVLSGMTNYNTKDGKALSAFANCTNLTSVSFPELHTIEGLTYGGTFLSAFNNSGVTHLSFPKLSAILGPSDSSTARSQANIGYNTTITRIDLPVLTVIKTSNSATTNNLTRVFSGCTNLVEIHFGAENQAIIEASDGYATKWGATNATIYFDL